MAAPASDVAPGALPICPDPGMCFLSQDAKDAWARERGCSFTDPGSPRFESGLGSAVDALVVLSPVLQGEIEQLLRDGWNIVYGPPGHGSTVRRQGADLSIIIDGQYASQPDVAVRTLAHEVGHAVYTTPPDTSSREAYVDSRLAGEGAATLMNIRVQREIVGNGGPDIGIKGNATNHPAYNSAYDRYLVDGDVTVARQTIGEIYRTGEIASVRIDGSLENYGEFYGRQYDRYFGSN